MMAPNGTRFGGWLLNTADNKSDFDGRFRWRQMCGDFGHKYLGNRNPQTFWQYTNCSYNGTQWNKVWWLVVKHC